MPCSEPVLLTDRHVKYWLRCAKTFLPEAYTSNDSNRMTLAFFVVSALDLLDLLTSKIETEERNNWISWIYSCQLENGGFRGFTGTRFGNNARTSENQHWDPANVPATFFALATLIILGDDLSRVRRRKCLVWLPKVQRENGSFGETLGENESIEGGSDLRFCCCAAGVRYVLRGAGDVDVPDLDVDRLVSYISACQTYDGGFSKGPGHESHSGLTYCAIGALAFLNQTPDDSSVPPDVALSFGISLDHCTRWTLDRQTTHIEEDEIESDEQTSHSAKPEADRLPSSPFGSPHAAQFPDTALLPPKASSSARKQCAEAPVLNFSERSLRYAGFNGRPNKIADTCYSFWNAGALAMLHRLDLIDKARMRRYLLEKTQHIVGGFGKGVGEPPDIMHAYLGLAALATIGEEGLPAFDPMFCMSRKARQNLRRVSCGIFESTAALTQVALAEQTRTAGHPSLIEAATSCLMLDSRSASHHAFTLSITRSITQQFYLSPAEPYEPDLTITASKLPPGAKARYPTTSIPLRNPTPPTATLKSLQRREKTNITHHDGISAYHLTPQSVRTYTHALDYASKPYPWRRRVDYSIVLQLEVFVWFSLVPVYFLGRTIYRPSESSTYKATSSIDEDS